MVWAFFLAYFVAGGYYNLVMHLQLYHRWRCGGGTGGGPRAPPPLAACLLGPVWLLVLLCCC